MSTANFKGAELTFDGSYVIMTTNRAMKMLLGKTGFKIPLASVRFLEYRPPKGLNNGYLRVNTGEPPLAGGPLDQSPAVQATKDPHSFHFTGKGLIPAVEALKAEIENAMAAQAPVLKQGEAPSDQVALLSQLAELRNNGVLSEAEFEAKKADILSRM